MSELKELWGYRYFVLSSIKAEFTTRFSRSVLGGFWGILNPLAQAAIYAVVLSYVIQARLPDLDGGVAYSIYLLSGIACWSLFNDTLQRSLVMFPNRASTLQKVSFPRLTIPVITVFGALLDNIVLVLCVLAAALLLGHQLTSQIFWLPLLIMLTALISGAFGLFLGILNVFSRDVAQFVNIALQLLFWGTPIVYSLNMLPESISSWLVMNPLCHLVMAYQNVILYGKPVDYGSLMLLLVMGLVGSGIASLVYMKSRSELMDTL